MNFQEDLQQQRQTHINLTCETQHNHIKNRRWKCSHRQDKWILLCFWCVWVIQAQSYTSLEAWQKGSKRAYNQQQAFLYVSDIQFEEMDNSSEKWRGVWWLQRLPCFQKSRDIIGIHPIADRIGGNHQLKDAFDSYEVTIFICVSSIDLYSTAPWKATVECVAWEINFDLIYIFIMIFKKSLLCSVNRCSWTVIIFYFSNKININERRTGHVHRQEQI